MASVQTLAWIISAAVLGAGAGFLLTPWVQRLVAARTGTPVAGFEAHVARWINPRVVIIGAAAAAVAASLVSAPAIVKVTLMLAAVLGWLLVCVDAAIHKLPDPLTACAAGVVILGLGLQAFIDGGALGPSLQDVAAGNAGGPETTLPFVRAAIFGVAGFVAFAILHALRPGALGRGDIKLAGVCGLLLGWFGWNSPVIALWAAFIGAGVFAVALLLMRRATRSTMIAFGPWMIFGTAVAIAVA